MLKSLGIILIIFSGVGAGFSVSHTLVEREQSLKAILRMVVLLKGEIQYRNASLPDAFSSVAEKMKGKYCIFLKEMAMRMSSDKGKQFGQMFRECASEKLGSLCLKEEEKEALLSLGDHLGYLGLDMQIKQLELYERELLFSIEELKKELPEKRKIVRSLGIMGGILLAVLVW